MAAEKQVPGLATDVREGWLAAGLDELAGAGLGRCLRPLPALGGVFESAGRRWLNFSSNDYLGLARQAEVVASARSALDSYGAGATSSRLVAGTLDLHARLEARLAAHKGYPAALVFGSGFLTNLGVIAALAGRDDVVFADRLVHASVVDAVRLAGATLQRFRHNDPEHLRQLLRRQAGRGRRLVVTESVFSMDGDLAPLPALAAIAVEHGAMLMVDEAHATGVFGPGGGGCVAAAGLTAAVNLAMGTLSKALGGYGGFVACSELLSRWLVNRARAFIYTTGLPPASVGAALGALQVLERQPGLGAELLRRAEVFRLRLQAFGLDTGQSASQIVPVLVGDNQRALAVAERLRRQGILVVAIRPPTVPAGTARLRLSVSLAHTSADLEQAAEAIAAAVRAAR